MGIADHHFHQFSHDADCHVQWTAIGDHELGLEAALPYLLDHSPATFIEPAPAVLSLNGHAA
jgi:hypothetical protein